MGLKVEYELSEYDVHLGGYLWQIFFKNRDLGLDSGLAEDLVRGTGRFSVYRGSRPRQPPGTGSQQRHQRSLINRAGKKISPWEVDGVF